MSVRTHATSSHEQSGQETRYPSYGGSVTQVLRDMGFDVVEIESLEGDGTSACLPFHDGESVSSGWRDRRGAGGKHLPGGTAVASLLAEPATGDTSSEAPLLLLLACVTVDGSDTAGKSQGTEDTRDSGTSPPTAPAPIALRDVDNYVYSSTFTLPVQEVAVGEDVRFNWEALTMSIDGQPMSCDDGQLLTVAWFRYLDAPAVTDRITCGSIVQSDVELITLGYADGDCDLSLSQTSIPPDTSFDPDSMFASTEGTWLARLGDAEDETLTIALFAASDTSTAVEVTLDDDAASLAIVADFAPPIVVAPGAHEVDWSSLTGTAMPDTCDAEPWANPSRLWLARFDGRTVQEIEANVTDLDALADVAYTAIVSDTTTFDLYLTTDEAGGPFPGFSAGELWVVGLLDSLDPMPHFLGALSVEE